MNLWEGILFYGWEGILFLVGETNNFLASGGGFHLT